MESTLSRMLKDYDSGRLTRRELLGALGMLVAAAPLSGVEPHPSAVQPVGVHHIEFGVSSLARSRDFYRDFFGMRVTRDLPEVVHLDFGISRLVIRQRPEPGIISHFCVAVDPWDATAVGAHLQQWGIEGRPSGDSFYFEDPDGLRSQISSRDLGGRPGGEAGR